jgi:hypothetical protein
VTGDRRADERPGDAASAAADQVNAEQMRLGRARLLDRVNKTGEKIADVRKHEMTAAALAPIIPSAAVGSAKPPTRHKREQARWNTSSATPSITWWPPAAASQSC